MIVQSTFIMVHSENENNRKIIEERMMNALKKCQEEGITDQEIIRQRITDARNQE